MSKLRKKLAIMALIVAVISLLFSFWISFTHVGRATWNLWTGSIQKVDDATNYNTQKDVENTCRAMISSYEADRLMYEQYKRSDNEERQSWSEQAKMRANKTAAVYNNYILENSFVWKGNIPKDIMDKLPYLE